MRLADDALLRDEVRDLAELRTAMQARSLRRARWIWSAGLAASLLVVALWRARPAGEPAGGVPPDQPRPGAPVVAVVMDGGRSVGLGEDGHLAGVPGLSARLRDTVAGALRRGAVQPPQGLTALRPPSITFMGAPTRPPAFAVVSPVGMMVRGDRPLMRWTPLAGAKEYTVSIHDQDLASVAQSPAIQGTAWRPPTPLPRDRTYVWQVAAHSADGRVIAPQPPSPEARFRILSASEATALDEGSPSRGQLAARRRRAAGAGGRPRRGGGAACGARRRQSPFAGGAPAPGVRSRVTGAQTLGRRKSRQLSRGRHGLAEGIEVLALLLDVDYILVQELGVLRA